MTSTSLSMPALSLSSLSLFSIDSGPDQDNTISTTPDTPMSDSRMSLDMHSSFNDSSHDSLPQLQEPRGPTHLVYNAISAIYSRWYQLDRKFRPVRPPTYLPLILMAHKDNEELYHLFRQHLHIDPITFDKILVEISSNPLFINQSQYPLLEYFNFVHPFHMLAFLSFFTCLRYLKYFMTHQSSFSSSLTSIL